ELFVLGKLIQVLPRHSPRAEAGVPHHIGARPGDQTSVDKRRCQGHESQTLQKTPTIQRMLASHNGAGPVACFRFPCPGIASRFSSSPCLGSLRQAALLPPEDQKSRKSVNT